MAHSAVSLPVDTALYSGIDVGGTKIGILDSRGETYHRYTTSDFPNMEAVLDDYLTQIGRRPAKVVLAMAGPRDDETGAIELSNGTWPEFSPLEAEKRYPGTSFETVNDMVGTAAGALVEEGVELQMLKSGMPKSTGCALVVESVRALAPLQRSGINMPIDASLCQAKGAISVCSQRVTLKQPI